MPAEGENQAKGGDKDREQPKKHPEYNQKVSPVQNGVPQF